MTFTVTRTGTSEVPIALDYATANGTAVAGQDYTAMIGGTVTFAAGHGRHADLHGPDPRRFGC